MSLGVSVPSWGRGISISWVPACHWPAGQWGKPHPQKWHHSMMSLTWWCHPKVMSSCWGSCTVIPKSLWLELDFIIEFSLKLKYYLAVSLMWWHLFCIMLCQGYRAVTSLCPLLLKSTLPFLAGTTIPPSNPKLGLFGFPFHWLGDLMILCFPSSEIGPVTITTDPKKFQYELRELYVQVSQSFASLSILRAVHLNRIWEDRRTQQWDFAYAHLGWYACKVAICASPPV